MRSSKNSRLFSKGTTPRSHALSVGRVASSHCARSVAVRFPFLMASRNLDWIESLLITRILRPA